MKIEKLTEEFTLTEEGNNYILNYGTIKRNVPVTTKFRFTETDNKNFTVTKTCGCSIVENKKIDDTTYETALTYDAGNVKISKTVVITNGKQRKELKLIGQTE
ncbi:MAG TPA: hypothetical protein VLA48_03200 [Nitrososphaeraceae archaeon]|nr:hypothetical protein [Nitrososphaeraceae archaeon]